MEIICSNIANKQINNIYTHNAIYNQYGHFTQQFINWNTEFHRYVNPRVIGLSKLKQHGRYKIGTIGECVYEYFTINEHSVFEIIEFHFYKLPYSTTKNQVISDAGYGYKIVQSTNNGQYAVLTPQRRLLTKYAFDSIIGFHHSTNGYNTIYAIGFIGNRVYAIYPNGEITMFPYSKEEYLRMKHKYYENKAYKTQLISENMIRRIVDKVIHRLLN